MDENERALILSCLIISGLTFGGIAADKALNPKHFSNQKLASKLEKNLDDERLAKEYRKRHLGNEEYAVEEMIIPTSKKVFAEGEHIIKVDITEEGYLIPYDGYDLINVVNNGKKIYAIYQNNIPVIAVTDDEGYYYMFGTPVSEYENSRIDKTQIKKKVR